MSLDEHSLQNLQLGNNYIYMKKFLYCELKNHYLYSKKNRFLFPKDKPYKYQSHSSISELGNCAGVSKVISTTSDTIPSR